MNEKPKPDVVDVFRRLDVLIKAGQFSIRDLEFMERYLGAALESTRAVLARAREAAKTPSERAIEDIHDLEEQDRANPPPWKR